LKECFNANMLYLKNYINDHIQQYYDKHQPQMIIKSESDDHLSFIFLHKDYLQYITLDYEVIDQDSRVYDTLHNIRLNMINIPMSNINNFDDFDFPVLFRKIVNEDKEWKIIFNNASHISMYILPSRDRKQKSRWPITSLPDNEFAGLNDDVSRYILDLQTKEFMKEAELSMFIKDFYIRNNKQSKKSSNSSILSTLRSYVS